MDNSTGLAEAARIVAGMHRRSRWIGWVAVGAGFVVGVSGCADEGEGAASTAPPSIDAAPSETSDDELVAQAREVYENFRAATDAMYAASDADYTLLTEWATDEVATAESAGVQALADEGITTSGTTVVTAFDRDASTSQQDVFALVCEDISDTTISAADGSDLTPADRDPLVDLRVEFDQTEGGQLLVSAVSPWTGNEDPPCSA